jgi:hypothetical protein
MFNIKFNAIDIDNNMVYLAIRNVTQGKKSANLVERTFPYDKFIELEPELAVLLEGDAYYIFLQDNHTEKKFLDGTLVKLTEKEINYIKSLINKACIDLAYEDSFKAPSVDDQIEDFIKEFFEDEVVESKDSGEEFLENFFKELKED